MTAMIRKMTIASRNEESVILNANLIDCRMISDPPIISQMMGPMINIPMGTIMKSMKMDFDFSFML